MNQAALQLWGYSAQDVQGKNVKVGGIGCVDTYAITANVL